MHECGSLQVFADFTVIDDVINTYFFTYNIGKYAEPISESPERVLYLKLVKAVSRILNL